MKSLSLALKTELASTEYIAGVLVDINIGSHFCYYTSWSAPICYNSIMYVPRGMQVNDIVRSDTNILETASIEMDDVDRALYTILSEIGQGEFPVTFTLVILDSLSKVSLSLVVFNGVIDDWDYRPGSMSLSIVDIIFVQWAQETTALFSRNCRYKQFKDVNYCQYSGTASVCDRTYETCKGYNNEANFGGYRWLPSMINKKLEV